MIRIDVTPPEHGDGLLPLQAARDRLRRARADGAVNDAVEIVIHAGRYALSAPLELTFPDFGTAESPVTWRAADDGRVLLTGARRVVATRPAAGQPAVARLATSLPVPHVFSNGKRLHPARYPNHDSGNPWFGGFLYADEPPTGVEPARDRLWSRDPRLAAIGNFAGAELVVFPRYNYRNNRRAIASFDPATGKIQLAQPATYEIDPGDRFYVQHLAGDLDAAGEWIHTQDTGELTVIPFDDTQRVSLDIPEAHHVIVVRGTSQPAPPLTVDGWGYWDDVLRQMAPPDHAPAAHLVIADLSCEGCIDTAIQVESVSDVRIEACSVRHAGKNGIAVVGGHSCQVLDCDISDVGEDGIVVAGGVRRPFNGTKVAGGHTVSNCYVHHIGLDEKHVAGVSLAGVGNTVANCLIHDAPRWGILSRGNDQLIEYNHIRHVNIETSDTAGIYLCDRDFSMHGTIIRFNRIHDILGFSKTSDGWISPSYAFGIYLDDWTSGDIVHGNLTYNTPRAGIYINSGHSNVVTNNCCLSGSAELGYYHRWTGQNEYDRFGTHGNTLRWNRIERNIFLAGEDGTFIYGLGRNLTEDGETAIESNAWNRNLIWNHGRPLEVRANGAGGERVISWSEWTGRYGQDRESDVADPLLRDDYTLAPGSPALALGFIPLPIGEMGLHRSAKRPQWPPPEANGVREHPHQVATGRSGTS